MQDTPHAAIAWVGARGDRIAELSDQVEARIEQG